MRIVMTGKFGTRTSNLIIIDQKSSYCTKWKSDEALKCNFNGALVTTRLLANSGTCAGSCYFLISYHTSLLEFTFVSIFFPLSSFVREKLKIAMFLLLVVIVQRTSLLRRMKSATIGPNFAMLSCLIFVDVCS